MAGDIATAYVRLRPDATGFQQDAEKQLQQSLSGLKSKATKLIAGAGIAEIISSTIEAAAGKQQAERQIETTVKNAGAAWKVYGKTVAEILDEQESKTGFDFEEQAQAFGRLEQQSKNSSTSLHLLGVAEDIARARGLELSAVAVALSKAQAGNYTSLQRLGIILPKYTENVDRVKKAHDDEIAVGVKLSKLQQAEYKDRLAAAGAADKQQGSTNALAEVEKRYAGQTASYLNTASGSLARFNVSRTQLQEAIGTGFLPLLTEGANALSDWTLKLSKSGELERVTGTAAHDLGDAIHTIGDAIHAIEPLLSFGQKIIDTVGTGPIIAFVAAWKLLPPVLALAGSGEAALSAETVALQASITSVQAGLDSLSASIAAVGTEEATTSVATDVLATSTASLAVETGVLEGAQASLFTAEEAVAGAQLQLTSSAELAAAAEGTLGTVVAGTIGEHAAATTAMEAEATAADALAGSEKAAAVGATGLLGPLALAAGAIYYLSQRADEGDKALANFQKTYSQIGQDKAGTADAANDVAALTRQYVELGKQAQLAAALQAKVDGSFDEARRAGQGAGESVNLYVKALEELRRGAASSDPILQGQITRLENLAKSANRIPSEKTITLVLNDRSVIDNLALDEAAIDRIVAKAAGLSGDLSKSIAAVGQPGGVFGRPSTGPQPLDKNFSGAFGLDAQERRILAKQNADAAAAAKAAAKLAARTYSQEFVSHIDVSGIGQALNDAIASARSNLTTSAGSLADAVGSALDARLAQTEKKLSAAQTLLQDDIAKRSAAQTARDNQATASDAQAKLDQLRSVYGGGALTAAQAQEIQQAQNAVLDAQDSIANASDQGRIDALDKRKTQLEAESALEKTYAQRRIADLSDEVNRGVITQATYVKDVQRVLAKENVTYRNTGALLGKSFADGFADSLKSVIAQAKALGGVGAAKLKSTSSSPKAVDPLAAGDAAYQSLVAQIAQSSGKISLDNVGKLPKGVNVAGLLDAARRQRDEDNYRVQSGKAQATGLQYAQQTNRHLEAITTLLKNGTHVVVSDGTAKKKTRATAKATSS